MKNYLFYLLFFLCLLSIIGCKKERSCENCLAINKPPIADAGSDQKLYLPIDSIILDGSASSDPDGTIIKWSWKKISGPDFINIISPTEPKTFVNNLKIGNYKFELKVTDNGGLIAIDTIQIDIISPDQNNLPPVANAGSDQSIILPLNTVTLDGSPSTDLDNNISDYKWVKISGPASFNISNINTAVTPVTDLKLGEYKFELTVTDAGGLSDKDTVQINIAEVGVTGSGCNENRPLINAQLISAGTLSLPRYGMAVATAGNKILFAGGKSTVSGVSTFYSTVDIYDVTNQNWSIATLSEARTDIAVTTAGSKIFFAGGRSWNPSGQFRYYSTVDIYDAVSNTWSVSTLSETRSAIAAATIGNKVFFAGGSTMHDINWAGQDNQPTSKVDIYDLSTQTWSTAALSEARSNISVASLQNRIYFAGGSSPDPNSLGVSNRIDIYDNLTGLWSTSSLIESRSCMSSIAAGDKIYWAGGISWPWIGVFLCSVEIFDINTNTTSINYLHYDNWWSFNSGQNAVMKDSKIIFCITPWLSEKFDIYDINSNTWSIGILPSICTNNSIISVNNITYVAGGFVDGLLTDKVWKLEF